METEPKIYEKQLYEIWKSKNFDKELSTSDGEAITVLDTGVENIDTSGPDFKNARIRIGNLVYVGDVEIDSDYTDWKTHGHNINKRYNKVILHLSLFNSSRLAYVYNKEGRKIHSVCLNGFINKERISLPKTSPDGSSGDQEYNRTQLKCIDSNQGVDERIKTDFIYSLGVERFNKKCEKMYSRLKEIAYIKKLGLKEPVVRYEAGMDFLEKDFNYSDFQAKDLWQQLLYEYIFEALGYSKNKGIMLSLAQFLNTDYIRALLGEHFDIESLHSILFHVAGLIPEKSDFGIPESNEYVRYLKEVWNSKKHLYDGHYFDETQWHFFKLRPQNFPTIRLAGGAVLLRKILAEDFIRILIKKFDEIRNADTLIRSAKSLFIVKSDGFWKTHYVFDHKCQEEINYFVGGARADEIVINVVLPFISIYGEVFGKKELSQRALTVYSTYTQLDDNNIVKFVAGTLNIGDAWKRSILSQGMIELFRNYCSKGRCLECVIGKASFE